MLNNHNYRPDIDGLRAIAVLGVVVFHAFPSVLPGGFIGVDVFFVISGFLISTILMKDLDNRTFSLSNFYLRRVRRIVPSLLLILCFCYLIGWFVLFKEEFAQLGKHIVGGAIFISNILLWREAGYFDASADSKPLLHLWSLGIEEQFYIVWPVLLWLGWRFKIKYIFIIILLATISFGLNLYGVRHHSVATFYFPGTRFWELLLGAGLAWYRLSQTKKTECELKNHTSKLLNSLVSVIGLLILVTGFFLINQSVAFPGAWALLPVMGALALIYGGPDTWVNRYFFSNKVLVWFGLISFPLYLWHWPLLSFARIVLGDVPSVSARLMLVALSILLAWLTYRLIEMPIRFGRFSKSKSMNWLLILMLLIVGYIGYNTYQRDGLPFRPVEQNISASDGGNLGVDVDMLETCGISDPELQKKYHHCLRDPREPVKYALIGDSKADAIFNALVRASTPDGRWLFIGGTGSKYSPPVPVISDASLYESYQVFAKGAIAAVANDPNIETAVLVTSTRGLFGLSSVTTISQLADSPHYSVALDGLKNTINIFKQAGKKVVFVVDNPTLLLPEDCKSRTIFKDKYFHLPIRENCQISVEKHLELSAKYRQLLDELKHTYPEDVEIFDTLPYLCNDDQMCTHLKNGRRLYSYSDHISDYAAGLIAPDLNQFLAKISSSLEKNKSTDK